MSSEEHTIENSLLKERCRLINTGKECKFIKICGNSLYVRNKLHGSVTDTHFYLATNSTNTTDMETQDQQSPMDSNTNESNPPLTQTDENNSLLAQAAENQNNSPTHKQLLHYDYIFDSMSMLEVS